MNPSFRQFLGKKDRLTLPYLEGQAVVALNGSFRVKGTLAPGFYVFELRGRAATVIERAEAPDLSGLRTVRGHLLEDAIVMESAFTERVHLLPPDELPRFSPVIARRWHSGQLLFESTDFETHSEAAARRAYEDKTTLAQTPGIPATLRAAFAFAVAAGEAQNLGIHCAPIEIRPWIVKISDGGGDQAAVVLREIAQRRAAHQRERYVAARDRVVIVDNTADKRVENALRNTGARLCSIRRMEDSLLEVRYEFLGTRLAALVRQDTLQVIDAGICLQGADKELALHNLPGVIREAIGRDELVITYDR